MILQTKAKIFNGVQAFKQIRWVQWTMVFSDKAIQEDEQQMVDFLNDAR